MSEAAIMQAAREAAPTNRVYRSEGDLWTDGPINLSRFVRFLARQPYVVDPSGADGVAAYERGFRDGVFVGREMPGEWKSGDPCPSCNLPYSNGDTCPAGRGGCPMGGDF